MDEKTYKWINRFIIITVFLSLVWAMYLLLMGLRTPEELLLYVVYIIVGGIGLYFVAWATYKLLLEKHVYKYKRNKTYELLSSEYIPSEIAVIGDRRGGKDTLATIMVRENADVFFKKIEKELKNLKNNILYIFDFKKIDKYLNSKKAKKKLPYLSKNEKRKAFKKIFYYNRGFLKGRYIKQYSGEKRRFEMKFIQNKKSGIYFDNKVRKECFFDLLMDYIEGYIRIYVIEKMVISNQPFLEKVEHLDGETRAAKKLSYDYFKIKVKKLFPWIRFLIIYDTESTLYYNNSDQQSEKENKGVNGTLEFFIAKGHFLKMFKYITTIQDSERAQLWYRNLFELKIYILDKFKIVSTSPIRRFFKRFKRGFYKVMNFLIFKRSQNQKFTSFLLKVSKEYDSRFKRILAKVFIKLLVDPIHFTQKRIKDLTQQENILFMESKLEFMNVKMEFRHKNDSFVKRSIRSLNKKGFKGENIQTNLVIDILDSWPYFSSEHLGDAGDTMAEESRTKFHGIPEWDQDLGFNLKEDGKYLNHKLYTDILETYGLIPKKKKATPKKKKN